MMDEIWDTDATGPAGHATVFLYNNMETNDYFTDYTGAETITLSFSSTAFNTQWTDYWTAKYELTNIMMNDPIYAISHDNLVSIEEKVKWKDTWDGLVSEYNELSNQATAFGLASDSTWTNFSTAATDLHDYMQSSTAGDPNWSDLTVDSPITRTTFESNWDDYFTTKQLFRNRLEVETAKTANWSAVDDDDGHKPDPDADVTNANTAHDVDYVDGTAAATIKSNAADGAYVRSNAQALAYKSKIDSATLIDDTVISKAKLDTSLIVGGYIATTALTASNISTGTLDANDVTIANLVTDNLYAGSSSGLHVTILPATDGEMKLYNSSTVLATIGKKAPTTGFDFTTVWAKAHDSSSCAVWGEATNTAIYGTSSGGNGVVGVAESASGSGVRGTITSSSFSSPGDIIDAGVTGAASEGSPGVFGFGDDIGVGVYGRSNSTTNTDSGVYGRNTNGIGVWGYGGTGAGDWSVLGSNTGSLDSQITGYTGGVVGYSTATSGIGVAGVSSGSSGIGVFGKSANSGGCAIYAKAYSTSYTALKLEGKIDFLQSTSTGAADATFDGTASKPGSNSTNEWLDIKINGTTYYIAVWS